MIGNQSSKSRPGHAADLLLAQACAAGDAQAWEEFVRLYRNKLYSFALSLTCDLASARELADSLYASLYTSPAKLLSYNGLAPLECWLRVVLAQEHVNQLRRNRRQVPLDDNASQLSSHSEPRSEHPLLTRAVDAAFAALDPEDAFLLSSYYLDSRTLAEIGAVLGIHESSASRRLKKATARLRKRIITGLRAAGVSRLAAEEMLDVDVRELQLDIRSRLTQERKQDAFLS